MILRCFVFICVAVATAERGGGEETPKAKHIFDGAATVALARNEARPLSASMQQAPEQQQPLRSQLPGGTQEERKKPEAETRKERKLNDGYVMSGNAELQTAVGAWCSDEASAEATYGDISTWVTSQVTDMSNLFSSHCSTVYTFNANVSRWNIENVVSLRETFKNARAFNLPLNDWNTRNVIDLEGTFEYAFAFNQPLHKWNTSAVTTMDYLFRRALVFDQEINAWDVSSVRSMTGTFDHAFKFNRPLHLWNTANVENAAELFNNAKLFNFDLSSWVIRSIVDMTFMFTDAASFSMVLCWNMTSVAHTTSMFAGSAGSVRSDCLKCGAGRYRSSPDSCAQCPLGKYGTVALFSSGALHCLSGYPGCYLDAPTGATRCIPCSSGSYSATNDSLFCPLCPEGTYGPLPGASSCAECVAPNYQPFLGQINCSTCGPGFVVDKLNATTSCTSCDAPKFVSSIGQLECKNCSAGHVVDKVTAATMCSSCDAPNYVGSLGATACDSCGPGHILDTVTAGTTCVSCTAPQYVSSAGQTSCDYCSAGSYLSALTAATSCDSCDAGKYSNSSDGILFTGCTDCPEATFSTLGSTSCTTCETGSILDHPTGATRCDSCAPGSMSNKSGATSCVRCAPGSAQAAAGATSCEPCTRGTQSAENRTVCRQCLPGEFMSRFECHVCARGTFATLAVIGEGCPSCDPGKYADEQESTACKLCEAGKDAASGAFECYSLPTYAPSPVISPVPSSPASLAPTPLLSSLPSSLPSLHPSSHPSSLPSSLAAAPSPAPVPAPVRKISMGRFYLALYLCAGGLAVIIVTSFTVKYWCDRDISEEPTASDDVEDQSSRSDDKKPISHDDKNSTPPFDVVTAASTSNNDKGDTKLDEAEYKAAEPPNVVFGEGHDKGAEPLVNVAYDSTALALVPYRSNAVRDPLSVFRIPVTVHHSPPPPNDAAESNNAEPEPEPDSEQVNNDDDTDPEYASLFSFGSLSAGLTAVSESGASAMDFAAAGASPEKFRLSMDDFLGTDTKGTSI